MTTAQKLNITGFAGVIEELMQNVGKGEDPLTPTVLLFKEMVTLMQDLEAAKDPVDAELIVQKLQSCHESIKQSFKGYCEGQGKSVDEVYQYVEDPQNYSQEEWEKAQTVRREVVEKATTSAPASMEWARPRKHNNRKKG